MEASSTDDSNADEVSTWNLSDSQKERLALLLDRYLTALENGAPLSIEGCVEKDPELEGPLRCYVEGLEDLHDIATGFAPSSDTQWEDDESSDRRVLGDFELQQEIGRGGMGVVYRARQISLDRLVAIKLLPFASTLDSKQILRFKNEAHAAAQLNHPNIVPVHAIGAERGVHFYAMQYIDGCSLDTFIA
ncbi:MAG: protein kinase, partial [Planctomycetota bacterium]